MGWADTGRVPRSHQVDELEIRRNERVYGWQYNRNPFVDHPEWVETLWSGSCRK